MNDKHLRAWFIVFIIAVFLAGIGGGMIVDRLLGRAPAMGRRGGGPGGLPPGNPAVEMDRLANYLDLTAEQKSQLDKIFADRRKRLDEIRDEMQTRFRVEQQDFRDTIEKILTPDQHKRFQDWLAREPLPGIRGRGRGMGLGPGGGPGGGIGRGRGPAR